MPPKKATQDTKENVVAFGRVKNNLKMGCVGLPNVGKSSLFNLCMNFSELVSTISGQSFGADVSS
jgi:tRNA U34 5-carboxymethylaminomethyl modifying GTPase MnmE/TrmE